MKRLKLLIIMVLVVGILTNQSLAAQNTSEDLSKTEKNWEELKNQKAQLSDYQYDVLRALGASETQLKNITNEEVSQLLATGEVVNLEYINKYYDTKDIIKKLITRNNKSINKLKNLGYSQEEIGIILDNGIAVDILEQDNEKLKSEIDSDLELVMPSSIIETSYTNSEMLPSVMSSYGGDHIIRGLVSEGVLAETSGDIILFHNESVPYETEYGLDCPIGSNGWWMKLEYFEAALASAYVFVENLYATEPDAAGIRYNYNVYGEKSGSYTYHEGIDIAHYEGAPIYAPSQATVLELNDPDSSLSWLSLYIEDLNVTITYEHLDVDVTGLNNVSSYPEVGGARIGWEDNKGTSKSHTHVEVHAGTLSSPQINGDKTLVSLNPLNYLMFLGE